MSTRSNDCEPDDYDFLPIEIELAITAIFEKEIYLMRKLEILKYECEDCHDYRNLLAYE